MIKNNTVYNGKIKLMFDKHPDWSNCNSKLNKVHLNLGFTKLVSRIYITQFKEDETIDLDTREYRQDCIDLINKYTGGKIGNHYFDNGSGGNYCLVGFLAPDGTYMGDVSQGLWYYKNKMVVNKDCPHGTAIILKSDVHKWFTSSCESISEEDLFDCEIDGIAGFNDMVVCKFRLGDKVFDSKWRPSDEDLKSIDYKKMINQFEKTNKGLNNSEYSLKDKIVESISFRERGDKVIETWDDAKIAAKNLSKYLG